MLGKEVEGERAGNSRGIPLSGMNEVFAGRVNGSLSVL